MDATEQPAAGRRCQTPVPSATQAACGAGSRNLCRRRARGGGRGESHRGDRPRRREGEPAAGRGVSQGSGRAARDTGVLDVVGVAGHGGQGRRCQCARGRGRETRLLLLLL